MSSNQELETEYSHPHAFSLARTQLSRLYLTAATGATNSSRSEHIHPSFYKFTHLTTYTSHRQRPRISTVEECLIVGLRSVAASFAFCCRTPPALPTNVMYPWAADSPANRAVGGIGKATLPLGFVPLWEALESGPRRGVVAASLKGGTTQLPAR